MHCTMQTLLQLDPLLVLVILLIILVLLYGMDPQRLLIEMVKLIIKYFFLMLFLALCCDCSSLLSIKCSTKCKYN